MYIVGSEKMGWRNEKFLEMTVTFFVPNSLHDGKHTCLTDTRIGETYVPSTILLFTNLCVHLYMFPKESFTILTG